VHDYRGFGRSLRQGDVACETKNSTKKLSAYHSLGYVSDVELDRASSDVRGRVDQSRSSVAPNAYPN
jgi:hypothetical protein